MRFSTLPGCCGLLAAMLGIELIAGWLLHIEAMVRILPTSNSVSFNTAVAFVLAGTALMAGQKPWQVQWRKAVAGILIVVGSLVLYEDIFDVALGLDWETLHRTVKDGSPRPGRVAPNTCAALILLGIALWNYERCHDRACRLIIVACCSLQLILVATGVVGLLLDPTLMFGWYKFNRMAAPTAFGLGLLTLGMYAGYRSHVAVAPLSSSQQQKSILLTGTLILLGMGMACALTTFIIFANYQQVAIREKLVAEITSQIRLADFMLENAASHAASLASRPLLLALIHASRHDPAQRAQLADRMTRLLEEGFSSMSLQWTDSAPPVAVGKAFPVELSLDLKNAPGSSLLWNRTGFVYKTGVKFMLGTGEVIGILTTEAPLAALADIYKPTMGPASSADFFICGNDAAAVSCFPSRGHPTPLILAPASRRAKLPVDEALSGKSGVQTAVDYRGVNVVAAFSHIGNTGLGVVSKVDAAELYEPINFLLSRTLLMLSISLAIGVFLLRQMVAPLVKSLVRSEGLAKESEARAVAGRRRLKSITNNVPALIGFIDKNMIYQFANATHERWFGKAIDQIVGKSVQDLHGENNFHKALPRMIKALDGNETVDFTYKTDSEVPGFPAYLSVSYIPERDDEGNVLGFNVLEFDATEHHERQQALTHLAYHDSLTGLPNRRLFEDRLEHAIARGRRQQEVLALMYLDIDNFKRINDTLGHDRGDLLLREFSKRLSRIIRSSDTVARLGGDEFTIVMESLHSQADAGVIAQKILDAIRIPFDLDGNILHVTTSIGISFAYGTDTSVEGFLQCSDTALYAAKTAGRNRYSIFKKPLAVVAESLRNISV